MQAIPFYVCMALGNAGTDPKISKVAVRRNAPVYPIRVTMPDGKTTLVVTAEAAAKANKAIRECFMMPEDSTCEEIATHQYLLWQENLRLNNYQATLDEHRRQASASSARSIFPPNFFDYFYQISHLRFNLLTILLESNHLHVRITWRINS